MRAGAVMQSTTFRSCWPHWHLSGSTKQMIAGSRPGRAPERLCRGTTGRGHHLLLDRRSRLRPRRLREDPAARSRAAAAPQDPGARGAVVAHQVPPRAGALRTQRLRELAPVNHTLTSPRVQFWRRHDLHRLDAHRFTLPMASARRFT